MKKATILLAILVTMFSTSCMVTKTNINSFENVHEGTRQYSKQKQFYVLFDLIRVGHTDAKTPSNGQPCQIKTQVTFLDGLIKLLTAGLISSQTIKVTVPYSVK